jgi:hypothetical protein
MPKEGATYRFVYCSILIRLAAGEAGAEDILPLIAGDARERVGDMQPTTEEIP